MIWYRWARWGKNPFCFYKWDDHNSPRCKVIIFIFYIAKDALLEYSNTSHVVFIVYTKNYETSLSIKTNEVGFQFSCLAWFLRCCVVILWSYLNWSYVIVVMFFMFVLSEFCKTPHRDRCHVILWIFSFCIFRLLRISHYKCFWNVSMIVTYISL